MQLWYICFSFCIYIIKNLFETKIGAPIFDRSEVIGPWNYKFIPLLSWASTDYFVILRRPFANKMIQDFYLVEKLFINHNIQYKKWKIIFSKMPSYYLKLKRPHAFLYNTAIFVLKWSSVRFLRNYRLIQLDTQNRFYHFGCNHQSISLLYH